tara:strand:+ start:1726 stop:3636 length:1911 start_codon:yes stop_codon:yes gene_type:complete
MPFQVSPGVNVSEVDLTTVVPSVSTTEGGIAGHFHWGPVEQRVLLSSEDQLVSQFGKPTADTFQNFFTAANFLSYGNALYAVRTNSTGMKNATSSAGNSAITLIKNADDYVNNYGSGISNIGAFAAKYPGALGNSLKVSMCPSSVAYKSTLSGTFTITSNTTSVIFSANQSATLVAGDMLEIGPVLGSKQDVRVSSIAANGTSATLATTYTGASASANTGLTRKWEYSSSTSRAPGTTQYATNTGSTGDAMHIAVIDEDGQWTGIKGTVIEVFENISKASDAKDTTGSSNYYKDVINNRSKYVWWADHDGITNAGSPSNGTTYGTPIINSTVSLVNGDDGTAATAAEVNLALDKFKNSEDVDVSFIMVAGQGQTVATHAINTIAEVRKDCLVCLSPPSSTVVNNSSYEGKEVVDVVAYRDNLPSSTYAVMDSGWKYQYDKYSDVYRWIPCNGDTAGLMVRTDSVRDPWFSPAGFNRGNVKNVVKMAWNPRKADRDELYKNSINPIVTFPGQGTVLYGDKTLVAQPGSFDRINVRRLFMVLEKAISIAANSTLFEFNDDFTRAQFKNLVEPFLRDVKGRRGITDFKVVCDTTNNTSDIIDSNEFVGDIYIKPNRATNFIQLNFTAVRTGVEFSEITG